MHVDDGAGIKYFTEVEGACVILIALVMFGNGIVDTQNALYRKLENTFDIVKAKIFGNMIRVGIAAINTEIKQVKRHSQGYESLSYCK